MSLGYDGRMRAAIARRNAEVEIVKSEAESLKLHAAAQVQRLTESAGAALGFGKAKTGPSLIERHPWLTVLAALAAGMLAAPGLRLGRQWLSARHEKNAVQPKPPKPPVAPAYFKAALDAAVPVLIEALRLRAATDDGAGAEPDREAAARAETPVAPVNRISPRHS